MGLYGNGKCLFNDHVPNPFYMVKCRNPEVESNIVARTYCNECKRANNKKYGSEDLLNDLIVDLNIEQKRMVKKYVLSLLNGEI